jgi:hypothetical protein
MKNAVLLRTPALLALILLSASLQSCGASSLLPLADTPTRTATLIPTETTTPTPTPTVPFTEWPLVMAENFNEESESWPVGELNNEFVKGTVLFIGGKYYAKITAKKTAYWYCFPEAEDLQDVYSSVKVDQLNGSKNTEYGIIVRGGESTQYFFSISSMLMGYEFNKIADEGASLLTLWTRSSQILAGEPNTIAVKAEGTEFSLYINGIQVDDAVDPEMTEGRTGLGILFPRAGDWIEITFDNYEVRAR